MYTLHDFLHEQEEITRTQFQAYIGVHMSHNLSNEQKKRKIFHILVIDDDYIKSSNAS